MENICYSDMAWIICHEQGADGVWFRGGSTFAISCITWGKCRWRWKQFLCVFLLPIRPIFGKIVAILLNNTITSSILFPVASIEFRQLPTCFVLHFFLVCRDYSTQCDTYYYTVYTLFFNYYFFFFKTTSFPVNEKRLFVSLNPTILFVFFSKKVSPFIFLQQ